jgi:hypothetical protein
METRLLMTLTFKDPAWDPVLESWLQNTLDKETQDNLCTRLSIDAKFREDFCEWVKSLRGPGWQAASNKERASS